MSTQPREVKKSFYTAGSRAEIEMPPLDYKHPLNEDSSQQQSFTAQQQPENPFGSVPDELPEDSRQLMQSQPEESEEVDEVEEQDEVDVVESVAAPVKKVAQDSFKEIRSAKERAERERDALLSSMLEMQAKMQSQQVKQPVVQEAEEDMYSDLDPEALVEGKQLKKMAREFSEMKKQLKSYQSQSTEMVLENRIKANFPDFERVVSKENVEILNEQFPEIAQSLRDTSDTYNKAAAAYSVIKRFGIHKEPSLFEGDKVKALANAKKPRPLASVSPQQGDSPLSKANAFANGMTKDLQEQLRKEMYAAMKNH